MFREEKAGLHGKEVEIYTDGSCRGNPGPGGFAAVLLYKGRKKEISGFEAHTTNQRMEMKAAILGLSRLKEPCRVKLFSDSAYLVNAFNQGWLNKWKLKGWVTVKNEPVENQDLWQQLLTLAQRHQVQWIKVKGHSGNAHNERCDQLARQAILEHDGTG